MAATSVNRVASQGNNLIIHISNKFSPLLLISSLNMNMFAYLRNCFSTFPTRTSSLSPVICPTPYLIYPRGPGQLCSTFTLAQELALALVLCPPTAPQTYSRSYVSSYLVYVHANTEPQTNQSLSVYLKNTTLSILPDFVCNQNPLKFSRLLFSTGIRNIARTPRRS